MGPKSFHVPYPCSNLPMPDSLSLIDRAEGVLIGTAVGDALGAGYEFDEVVQPEAVAMRPGRLTGRPAGHWTDDTDMAMGIALAARECGSLDSPVALTRIAENFLAWFASHPPDVGIQTRSVLSQCIHPETLTDVAFAYQARHPDAAGNGSLMRTAPVALADFDRPEVVARTAMSVSALTHPHRDAQQACALWSVAIAEGLRGSPSLRHSMNNALDYLEINDRERWTGLLVRAEECDPRELAPNGWVVRAFQAAWRACCESGEVQQEDAFRRGVTYAIALGDDTDTIAAIAGGMLGAHLGANGIPTKWRRDLAGWPIGYGDAELAALARSIVSGRV